MRIIFFFIITGFLSLSAFAQEVIIKCEDYAVETGERIGLSYHCPFEKSADTVIWEWKGKHEVLDIAHSYRFKHKNSDSLFSNYLFLKLKLYETGLIELPSPVFYFDQQKIRGEALQLYVISEEELNSVYQSESFRPLLSGKTNRTVQFYFKGKYGYLKYNSEEGLKTIQLSKKEIKKVKRILKLK